MYKPMIQLLTLAALSVSLTFSPAVAHADIGCTKTQEYEASLPCDCVESKWYKDGFLWGGVAAAGLAVGAIAGACQKGKKGSRGSAGPEQNVAWKIDKGQTIRVTENISVTPNLRPGGYIRLTQVVIAPDNEVFQGFPRDVSAGGDFFFNEVIIENPREGNYLVGYVGESALAGGSLIQPNEVFRIIQQNAPNQTFASVLPFAISIPNDNHQAGINTTSIIYIK